MIKLIWFALTLVLLYLDNNMQVKIIHLKGKILTIDNLHKKKVWFLDWCYMCKSSGEIIDHLLMSYCI